MHGGSHLWRSSLGGAAADLELQAHGLAHSHRRLLHVHEGAPVLPGLKLLKHGPNICGRVALQLDDCLYLPAAHGC